VTAADEEPEPAGSRRFRCLHYTFEVVADRAEELAVLDDAFARFTRAEHDHEPQETYRLRLGPPEKSQRFAVEDGDGVVLRYGAEVGSVLDYLFWHVNDQVARNETEHVLVHAGSVRAPDGGVLLLPAPSGSGKTTTTLGLLRAGFGYLSDEFAVIDPGTLLVHPFPRPLSFKAGTRALFPEVDALALVPPGPGASAYVAPTAVGADPTPLEPDAVCWIVFIRHVTDHAPELEQLTAAQTVMRLAENTFNFQRRCSVTLPTLAAVAERARGYTLVSGDLDAAVRTLSAVVAGG
jgi:hypothetical protein